MTDCRNQGKYCKWSSDDLDKALSLIYQNKLSVNAASKQFSIPRRTLGGYVKSKKSHKTSAGRKPVLTQEQESTLVERIVRLADVGFPVTPKVVKRSVFTFCKENGLQHQFNGTEGCAGRTWFRGFLKRHPELAKRKAQHLNEARAEKLNRFIVQDYFEKLKDIFKMLDIMNKPERIFNVDEKGCRLSLHRQPVVLARKGSRRVHYRGKEHGENVTIVSCGNALGSVIPPMILFKGQRMKRDWSDNLPHGSVVNVTAKGSMTTDTFVQWLEHFETFLHPVTMSVC